MSEVSPRLFDLDRSVVLVGFMGAGKSSVGKRLAQRLQRPFVDVDSFIEQQQGRSIQQLFVQQGEVHFRALEQSIIAQLIKAPGMVMALGGGAYESVATRGILDRDAIVVYLQVDWPDIARNLRSLRPGRPVLAGLTDDEVHALFVRRAAAYELAPVVVHLARTGVKQAAEKVYEALVDYLSK